MNQVIFDRFGSSGTGSMIQALINCSPLEHMKFKQCKFIKSQAKVEFLCLKFKHVWMQSITNIDET